MKKPAATTPSAARLAFDANFDAGQGWLDWISEASKFEAILRDKIPWESLAGQEIATVQTRLKTVVPPSSLLMNSFYVTMVAGFEEYLRSYIREQAQKISLSNISFSDMDMKLIRMNMRESARLLKRLEAPPDYIRFDEGDLCRQLGTSVPGSKRVELNGDALAEVDGLLKLTSFMERIDVFEKKLTWDQLGGQQAIKTSLNLTGAKPREVGKALSAELNTIARYRNRIAHTGWAAADVTGPIAKQHRDILAATVAVIDSL